MNNTFLLDFKTIIRECNYTNTYKMAWAKALVELSYLNKETTDIITLKLEDVAYKMLKYYWNMTIYFDLIQGSDPRKPPTVVSIVKDLISKYKALFDMNIPIHFERIEHNFPKFLLDDAIKDTVKTIKQDVSWRFLNLNNNIYSNIYSYTKKDNELYMKLNDVITLKDNDKDLYDLINYRWALMLESFNSSPRINKKVKIIDEREIKRKPLTKFQAYLDLENPNRICFNCKKPIVHDLSIDHVIPWSYLYSDDIWNLVYLCRSCNSSKSNTIPSEEVINRLKERNLVLKDELTLKKQDKILEELNLTIEKDYVTKFWIGCKS